ncbi:alpha/beta fold hydrolase [Symbioplanes lichenis]|uniref:alpha/beta fold hydrolase n=1 Tax=Symbioplanes lichenis TaxID=1629072 RepID=UPI002739F5A2|nr:alpha/beta hydrolase [Actinoplanes lichenis]
MTNFVCIPGAWHGGWSWHPVGHRLRAAGHHVTALTMPGLALGDDPSELGLSDAVGFVAHEIERRDLTDVVLVSHSWGGIPATVAAPRLAGRVRRLAYVSAFVPLDGQSMADAMGEMSGYLKAAIDASPDRTIGLTFDQFQQGLMPDQPLEVQRIVFDQLVPQPGGYMLDAPRLAAHDVPAAYILAEKDQALAAPGPELAARVGAEPIMVPGSHEAILTHPDDIAAALLAL